MSERDEGEKKKAGAASGPDRNGTEHITSSIYRGSKRARAAKTPPY